MNLKTNIMGVMFDNYTIQETVQQATSFENVPFVIVTPNPEIVQVAKKDKEFKDVLNSANIVTPDGIGIVYASKILDGNIKQRAAGFDICCGILDFLAEKKGTVYLFGGKPGVAELASKNIEQKYKGVSVVGCSDGYFDEQKEKSIIEDIKTKKPDLLLVCLGAKKQELWIHNYKDVLDAKILIGAGGSIDVFAGTVKRAPDIFIKLGLEWLYRLIKQPKRFIRMLQLPLFLIEIVVKRRSLKS